MAGLSPTQRTLAYLKDMGAKCDICERWIQIKGLPGGGIRKDLFHIIDIICINKETGITGIQSCGSSFSEHKRKILIEQKDETRQWLEAGAGLQLIGWRKVKKVRGGKLMIWTPRTLTITLDMLEANESASSI
jgi:hypothetical protein